LCSVPTVSLVKFAKTASGEVNTHHICVECQLQFIEEYEPPKGYSKQVKQECLKMYLNGMGFRAIERVKGVHHTTVIYWAKQLGEKLPESAKEEGLSAVGELDELGTFIGSKKTRIGCGQQ